MELQELLKPEKTAAAITLATLPPDIVRLIIRTAGHPMLDLRLISPKWNEIVSERHNHPPLPAVHLHSGHREFAKSVVVKVDLSTSHAYRRIFDGWTQVPLGVKAESPSLRVCIIDENRRNISLFILYFIIFLVIVTFRFQWLISAVMLLCAAVVLVFQVARIRPAVVETRKKLARIFDRCSFIETLYLHKVNRETLDVVFKTFGDIHVKKLIVFEENFDQALRDRIIKWSRIHRVEKVVICTKTCEEKKLRNFFLRATETVNEVEIYESIANSEKIFGTEREFWTKKAQEMNDGSVSVQVMNGQQLEHDDDTHLLRFKIHA